jgi:hypothetical protein
VTTSGVISSWGNVWLGIADKGRPPPVTGRWVSTLPPRRSGPGNGITDASESTFPMPSGDTCNTGGTPTDHRSRSVGLAVRGGYTATTQSIWQTVTEPPRNAFSRIPFVPSVGISLAILTASDTAGNAFDTQRNQRHSRHLYHTHATLDRPAHSSCLDSRRRSPIRASSCVNGARYQTRARLCHDLA